MGTPTLNDVQPDLFAVQNALAAIGRLIEHHLDDPTAGSASETLYQIQYLQQHASADLRRLLAASDPVRVRLAAG
jgi:hypothetical protein